MGIARIAMAALAAAALGAGWPGVPRAADSPVRVQADSPAPSPTELQSFARAARAVFRVRQAYAPKVQSARSEMDARDFIVSAQKEMEEAIRREGMKVDRYNEILKFAQRDPALAGRIQELVDKAARGN